MPSGGLCSLQHGDDYESGFREGRREMRKDVAQVLNRMRSTANESDKAVLDSVASLMRLKREETVTYTV
jgi:hypothetical protein